MTCTSMPMETLPPRGAVVCRTTTSGGQVVRNSRVDRDSRIGK